MFSSCTVPIVMYPFWLENYFHTTGGCLPYQPPRAPWHSSTAATHPPARPPAPAPAFEVWASFLNERLSNVTWRPHAKVVLASGEGLRLPTMVHAVAQPLSNLSLESLADFSSRLVPRVRDVLVPTCVGGTAAPHSSLA